MLWLCVKLDDKIRRNLSNKNFRLNLHADFYLHVKVISSHSRHVTINKNTCACVSAINSAAVHGTEVWALSVALSTNTAIVWFCIAGLIRKLDGENTLSSTEETFGLC